MKMINLVEILKHCPKGMELHSTMFNNVKLKSVSEYKTSDYPICIETKSGHTHYLTKYGQAICNDDAKCVIFPKNTLTWVGFQRPFKDGDIVFGKNWCCSYITIFKSHKDPSTFDYYVSLNSVGGFNINLYADKSNLRFATKEEKQKLFEEMKRRGYKWNEETKTLKDLNIPKYKVGDRIRSIKNPNEEYTITAIYSFTYECKNDKYSSFEIWIKTQEEWEIVTDKVDKFDISTLVPFESKVLVRDSEHDIWKPALFGIYFDNDCETYKYFVVGGTFYKYLIPYEGNEHLRGKTDDCNEYYKTWNK